MAKGGGECLKIVSEGLLFFLMVLPRDGGRHVSCQRLEPQFLSLAPVILWLMMFTTVLCAN